MAETTIELPAFPWVWHQQGDANDHVLLTSGKQWVIAFRTNGEFMPAKEAAIIRRIVACVNSCAGVTTEDLKSGAVMVCGSNQVAYFDKVLQQRDHLLAALKRTVEYHVPKINPFSDAANLSAMSAIDAVENPSECLAAQVDPKGGAA